MAMPPFYPPIGPLPPLDSIQQILDWISGDSEKKQKKLAKKERKRAEKLQRQIEEEIQRRVELEMQAWKEEQRKLKE
ncbi:MAG: hypothetical protein K2N12_06810 [Helicobacter sp.]|nr:hypothetical protein [Helicobacter sp.]